MIQECLQTEISHVFCGKKKRISFSTACLLTKHFGKLEKVAFLPKKLQDKAPHSYFSPSQTTKPGILAYLCKSCTEPYLRMTVEILAQLTVKYSYHNALYTSSADVPSRVRVSGKMKGTLVAWP